MEFITCTDINACDFDGEIELSLRGNLRIATSRIITVRYASISRYAAMLSDSATRHALLM